MEAGESSSKKINKNRVQVTRRKKAAAGSSVTSELPIMEVFKKMEQLSTTAEETEADVASDKESNEIERDNNWYES